MLGTPMALSSVLAALMNFDVRPAHRNHPCEPKQALRAEHTLVTGTLMMVSVLDTLMFALRVT